MMASVRIRIALVLLAACLVGCGGQPTVTHTPRGPVIDGWPVGEAVDCAAAIAGIDCDSVIQVAINALAVRDRVRPDDASVTLYHYRQDQDGIYRSGGPPLIAVAEVPDQPLRAIGVKLYPGDIPPRVIDFGP
jgi:hypothetical protein